MENIQMTLSTMARSLTGAIALAAMAGCELASPQLGMVNLYLTDAPAAEIASARVWISHAYLVKAGEGDGEPFVTITDVQQDYDLLTLQNGVTALLGTETVPAGEYAQLRLVVDSARITLGGGATFADGSDTRTLFVPSGMQTGIKVTFAGPITIAAGDNDVVVDFPVDQNFVFQGPPTSPLGVLFTPTLLGTPQ